MYSACVRKKTCATILIAGLLAGLGEMSCRQRAGFDPASAGLDTAKINRLYDQGLAAVDTGNRTAGAYYFDKGIAASHIAGNAVYEGKGYLLYNYLYMTCGKMDSAEAATNKALDIFAKAGYKGAYYLSGRIARLGRYLSDNDFARAIDEGQQILEEAKAAKDTTSIAQTLGLLSSAAHSLTDNKKALQYLEEAVALMKRTNNRTTLEDLESQLAMAYDHTGQFNKELAIGYALLSTSNAESVTSGYTFATISRAHYGMGHFDSALYYLRKVAEVNKAFGDPTLDASVSSGLIDIYLDQKKYRAALDEIEKRIDRGLDESDSADLPALEGRRAEALEALGRYKEALQAERHSEKVRNYESGEEIHKQAALIEGKYRTREKEKAIAALSRTARLQQQWLVAVVTLLCLSLLLGCLALLQYRRQRKATATIARQADRLQWLMKEVHHRVKNNLQVVISLIHMQLKNEPGELTENLLNDTMTRIHSIALIHQKLYQNDSHETVALQDYVKQLAQAILAIHGEADTHIEAAMDLDIDTAVVLGMVITELITNSCKHAKVPSRKLSVDIRIAKDTDGYTMRYCDNGPGLPDNPAAGTMGMQIISLMVRQMGGRMRWSNEEGACCHIIFKDEAQRKLIA